MMRLAVVFVAVAGCGPSPSPAAPPPVEKSAAAEALSFKVPPEWVSEKPVSTMRKAQYRVPDRQGKGGDASLTLFHFGASGFSLESNIDRWRDQMGGADPNIEVIKGAASKTTLVDIAGTYAGDAKDPPIESARLLAGIVETSQGPWYFKFVGPAATVDGWKDAYVEMLKRVRAIE